MDADDRPDARVAGTLRVESEPIGTNAILSILLVEDDDVLRAIIARHLRHQGHAVIEAGSAEVATSALEGGLRPALVVLDINLPGGTGWDLLRSPAMSDASRPPVVIASAVTVSPKRLAEFGVAGYLPKPFPLETLLQTVARVIRTVQDDGGIRSA
jgi:DNA-binding response OmpR family regulator